MKSMWGCLLTLVAGSIVLIILIPLAPLLLFAILVIAMANRGSQRNYNGRYFK